MCMSESEAGLSSVGLFVQCETFTLCCLAVVWNDVRIVNQTSAHPAGFRPLHIYAGRKVIPLWSLLGIVKVADVSLACSLFNWILKF